MICSLILSLSGCKIDKISKPNTDTKSVSQESDGNYVTFDLDIPETYEVYSYDKNSITCLINSGEYEPLPYETSPCTLFITNYQMPNLMKIAEDYEKSYNNLFNSEYKGIEKIISNSIEYINMAEVIDSYPDVIFETEESIMAYFDMLVDGISTPDIKIPNEFKNKTWASDFSYNQYNTKNGKIIAVEYSFVFLDKTYKAINCYRNDHYSVCGVFADEMEISSGDIALWVASNMKVTEHYIIQDNVLKLEGVDY